MIPIILEPPMEGTLPAIFASYHVCCLATCGAILQKQAFVEKQDHTGSAERNSKLG